MESLKLSLEFKEIILLTFFLKSPTEKWQNLTESERSSDISKLKAYYFYCQTRNNHRQHIKAFFYISHRISDLFLSFK